MCPQVTGSVVVLTESFRHELFTIKGKRVALARAPTAELGLHTHLPSSPSRYPHASALSVWFYRGLQRGPQRLIPLRKPFYLLQILLSPAQKGPLRPSASQGHWFGAMGGKTIVPRQGARALAVSFLLDTCQHSWHLCSVGYRGQGIPFAAANPELGPFICLSGVLWLTGFQDSL